VNVWLNLPLAVRIAIVFVAGLALGGAVNWAIYTLAWFSRPISPWAKPHDGAAPRHWSDRLPVLGWLGLRREIELHGKLFWLRPILIELALASSLAGLYYWEVACLGLIPKIPGLIPPAPPMLHAQFLAHAILIALMTACTFIDFDEKTIPDEITLPGMLLGLCLAAGLPISLLPILNPGPPPTVTNLLFSSPAPFPAWAMSWRGPLSASVAFSVWCLALIPATSTLRRGTFKAVAYYLASIARRTAWVRLVLLAAVGSAAIWTFWLVGGASWQALFSAVAGMAFGAALIWSVRVVGTLGLREEAMGFGDVTLMAMIGAFLGWQSTLIVLFFSPAGALFVALAQWLFTGRRDIAFGPYLCVAAIYTIVFWESIWNRAQPVFGMGLLLLAILVACLMLMLGLLMLMRIIRQALGGNSTGPPSAPERANKT
jgi:prepilin signal peptidase PulO-like enzyme (type II secretory pathway)